MTSACAVYENGREATWRSGDATVCKTVYTSSILVVASNHFTYLGHVMELHRIATGRQLSCALNLAKVASTSGLPGEVVG